ncbi:hypothetical protein ACK33D_15665 [Aeromonas hydrophila]|uniref:hypothetical protein n=1 Tax=Aeromonas TaxID=642 RepID=UPI001117D2CE|nr:hypothetical protein [Aeromonas dhakensis]TNI56549.1 hypothetical protein CF126_08835 [Aeromonas dhakensis]
MNDILILTAVSLFFAYLIHCKRSALKRKAELAALLDTMLRDHNLTETEKGMVSACYDVADSWWAIPSMFSAVPVGFFTSKKRAHRQNWSQENKEVIAKFMVKFGETLVVGNPIMSFLFIIWTAAWAVIFFLFTMLTKWLWVVLAFTSPTFVHATPTDMAQSVVARTISAQQNVLHKLRLTHR